MEPEELYPEIEENSSNLKPCDKDCEPGTWMDPITFADNIPYKGCCMDQQCYDKERLLEWLTIRNVLPLGNRVVTEEEVHRKCPGPMYGNNI